MNDSKVNEESRIQSHCNEEFTNEPQLNDELHNHCDKNDDDCNDQVVVQALVDDFKRINAQHTTVEQALDDPAYVFEYEDDLIMPVEEDEVIFEITADTGAVDNVMNPREIPGFPIKESYGSKNGKHFMGAGAERIINEGEVRLSMSPVDGRGKLGGTFQAADITRTLMSISKVCDSAPDTSVTFTSKDGVVRRKGRDIAKFYRKGGLYVMQVKVKKPKPEDRNDGKASDFPRQGLKR